MQSVAIIGAGITGLTAAFRLRRAGFPVTLYEASPRIGGVIQSLRKDGYLAEFGPNTILETSPKITQLVRDAGLESRRIFPAPEAGARYVVRYGRPIAMPGSPLEFFTTELFTFRAKLAVLREPFVPPRRDGTEESIAAFVRRRLGQEFLDHAIDAMVAGVYAGDPANLSLQQAFPKLAALEARYGSLVKGQILGARERRKRREVAKDRAPKFSFDEGLQTLPDALGEQLGDAIKRRTSVKRLTGDGGGWTLALSHPDGDFSARHDVVVYAGTAHQLAGLPIGSSGRLQDLSSFSGVRHPPVASVVLGFRREDVRHPCQGFGALIPKVEGFSILGTIFSSSLFPNRAPAGHLTLTIYVGGERHPELAALPEPELVEVTLRDLKKLFGANGRPTFQHCALYARAIPQYNLGYGRYRKLLDATEAEAPGLYFAGHYRDGISLGDSIISGCQVAERIEKASASDQSAPA